MIKRQTTVTTQIQRSPISEIANQERKYMVEALAYQLWLQRGSPVGSDLEDWYEAERQLQHLHSALVRQAA